MDIVAFLFIASWDDATLKDTEEESWERSMAQARSLRPKVIVTNAQHAGAVYPRDGMARHSTETIYDTAIIWELSPVAKNRESELWGCVHIWLPAHDVCNAELPARDRMERCLLYPLEDQNHHDEGRGVERVPDGVK